MSQETFDAGWLALREGVDHRSRAKGLLRPLREWWAARKGTRVLDLGAGTGSNLRYLAPTLSGPLEWTLVDHDEALLSLAGATVGEARITTVCEDLSGGNLDLIEGAGLVTASALLDLVSEVWLASVVQACAEVGAAALFALNYDGGVSWSGQRHPTDRVVLDAVNRHQGGDKGFGPALGPMAGRVADAAFRARGYRTWLLPSPWVLGAADAEVVEALVGGWVAAAAMLLPGEEARLDEWASRRSHDLLEGRTSLTVSHCDLLALPPDADGH